LPGSTASGTFGLRLSPRSKPPAAYTDPSLQGELFLGNFSMDTEGEYGFFTPNGTNFTLINSGNPSLGQCVLTDSESGGGRHVPVAGARGWNCCTYTYETSEFDPSGEAGIRSQLGHAGFFVGTPPADPQPDSDIDLFFTDCDNCPATHNPTQEDVDGDGKGDACDNCSTVPNASQLESDSVPAGNDCECADVDASGSANLVDVVLMRRYLAGRANPSSFSAARCVVASGSFPCEPTGVFLVRRTLAGGGPPLVQTCP
jgi:hypothetical protein